MINTKYTKNGLTFKKCNSFRIVYHDAKKIGANYWNYCNAGFFGNFRSANNVLFTLPVGVLICDPWNVPKEGQQYILPLVSQGKLRYYIKDNHTNQFYHKTPSTLVVTPTKNFITKVYIPDNCEYAISGIPVIEKGKPASIQEYKAEGWDDSPMYATQRNWVGIRNNEIWLITGKTTTANYIQTKQIWNKIKDEKFEDVIALDGGGSYIFREGNNIKKTWENRRVNNLIVYT